MQTTETENMMTAVERIYDYCSLPPEPPLQINQDSVVVNPATTGQPPPRQGVLEFDSVSLKYDPEGEYVLKGLSFKTQPGEKIGIVGRTGAGKSSILQVSVYCL